MSSILTDAIRAGRLEEAGYQTQLLEFIDMEHTPKNILIRATFAGKPSANPRLDTLEKKLNLNLTIDKLLRDE
jgi:hypothetical protein